MKGFSKPSWARGRSANEVRLDSASSTLPDSLLKPDNKSGRTASIGGRTIVDEKEPPERERRKSAQHGPASIDSQGPAAGSGKDLLGLRLVVDNGCPSGDIIFVHGIGGHARSAWCWDKDFKCFWPEWLASEDMLASYRVFTFGYNSEFLGADTQLNVVDFAKELLFQMLTWSSEPAPHDHGDGSISHGHRPNAHGAQNRSPTEPSLKEAYVESVSTGQEPSGLEISGHNPATRRRTIPHIGQVPIIFVCHSMGGLVVKKAYVLGKHDPVFRQMLSQLYGIMFLSTPHKGAHYAKILNSILTSAPLILSAKSYIADLDTQSTALQDINEQFRIACGELALISFFETLKTGVGLAKIQVVQKDSGTLGYPQEVSCPLNADHHTICKFKNRYDGNYLNVRNALRLWAERIRDTQESHTKRNTCQDYESIKKLETQLRMFQHDSSDHLNPMERTSLQQLEGRLGVYQDDSDDLDSMRSRIVRGTCLWIRQRRDFLEWMNGARPSSGAQVFWLIGLPATGKSSIAITVAEHLRSIGHDCQHHFFSAAHQARRTTVYCLKSLALQLAILNAEVRERLLRVQSWSRITSSSQRRDLDVIWDVLFENIIFKVKFAKPIYWIFDAIDEVDLHQDFIGRILHIKSASPIRIFLTSRPMKIPSAVASYDRNFRTLFMSCDHTDSDIRAFVQHTVHDILPGDQQSQNHIIREILSKASGSFLWTKLAIEMLREQCHTQDDIQEVLTAVPPGMEYLYRRMLEKVESQPPKLQLMAKKILTWAVCAWRPLTVDELCEALEPEFTKFMNIKDTITQICGHFIAVDHSKATLIHETARQFLLGDSGNGAGFINESEGHKQLATACAGYLSNESWANIFKAAQTFGQTSQKPSSRNRLEPVGHRHPLLVYAACNWAYHVSQSPVQVFLGKSIIQFLFGHSRSWIEAIALSASLLHLTRSARYLKTYAKRLRSRRLDRDEFSLNLNASSSEVSLELRAWATDLIRIVGKFGSNLVQKPSSIHKLVIPFCPQNSMIRKVQEDAVREGLSVIGLRTDAWDDCLANISVGEDVTASQVLATDTLILVLVSSSGTVITWSSDTFEEKGRFEHNEYVSTMVVSSSGSLFVTAGLETYRVWELSGGNELHRLTVESTSLPLALALSESDSTLSVGLDDCTIRTYDLRSDKNLSTSAYREHHETLGCPRLICFSPDQSKTALAWRGRPVSLWDMLTGQTLHPKRSSISDCADPLNAPETLAWQRDNASLLILSQTGIVMEWQIYDDEIIDYPHVSASAIRVSTDGNLLLSSNNSGTISVWAFPKLSLIYQLSSSNEFIRDLTFSPDGQRVYDVRQSTCHAWEPDALVRPDEDDMDDLHSMSSISLATEPVIAHDECGEDAITSLEPNHGGDYFACGREDGTVMIHRMTDGKRIRKVYGHWTSSSVIVLCWSPSERYLASADDSGRIIAKRLEVKEPGKWAVFPVFDVRIKESVQQFFFSANERLVLVLTRSNAIVYNLKTKSEASQQHWSLPPGSNLVLHPKSQDLFLCITAMELRTYSWIGLTHQNTFSTSESNTDRTLSRDAGVPDEHRHQSISHSQGKSIRWAGFISSKQYIVYEAIPDSNMSTDIHLEFVSTSDLHVQRPHCLASYCVADLASQVKRLVGTYKDHIAFLDHDNWLCTWSIDSDARNVHRHFFLPRDWVNPTTVRMALLTPQGTFLCPRHGHVGILKNGMRF